jgi:CheY-like chemotaxis protein
MAMGLPGVLCADRDPGLIDKLREHLSRLGFIVFTAANGVEACLQFKRWAPRAVILDLFLPRLGGIGTLTRIRAMEPDVAVVLLSDRADALEVVVAAGLRVAAALRKPQPPEAIAAALRRAGVSVPAATGSRARPVKVLVVDDDPRFRQMVGDHLAERRVELATAASGEVALERLAAFEPDVVLLDLLMPGIGGLEALRRIRAAAPRTRVIMVTGHDDLAMARRALAAGAADYLTKPFRLDYLDSLLAAHAPPPAERPA